MCEYTTVLNQQLKIQKTINSANSTGNINCNDTTIDLNCVTIQ